MLHGVEVLIVEDSPTQATLLSGLLETHGCVVRTANNGLVALDLVAERRPTLIISDVVMPRMDGYELCRHLKLDPASQGIPILLVTSLSDARDVVRGLACGADGFILKPYEEKYLIARVRYFLANQEVRHNDAANRGVEVVLGGERHLITAHRQQILDLLISTYEQGIQLNSQLRTKHSELMQSYSLLDSLFHFSTSLTDKQNEHEVIEKALATLIRFPHLRSGWALLSEENALPGEYRLAGICGDLAESTLQKLQQPDCPCGHVQPNDDAHSAFNVTSCEVLPGDQQHACVPIRVGNDILGFLNVVRDDAGAWQDAELEALTTLGQQFATSLARVRFFKRLDNLVNERTAALRIEVAERERAEVALRHSEALIGQVLNTLPVGIWVTDARGGLMLHNPEAVRIWGGSIPQLEVDKTVTPPQVEAGDALSALRYALHSALTVGKTTLHETLQVVALDGEARKVLSSVVPLTDERQHIQGAILVMQDVTAQQVVDLELRLRERAIAASVSAIAITDNLDPQQPLIYVNQAFERITGYTRDQVLGRNCRFLQGDDHDQPGLLAIRRAVAQGIEGKAVLRNYRRDGSMFWNDLRVAPSFDGEGNVSHFVGVLSDISDIKRYQDELEHQNNFDTLTALPNRTLLLDRIQQAAVQANRKHEQFAVAFLDLDNFKYVNDSLGHSVGDRLLVEVANRIQTCVREFDTVARLGGDEFVLLLPEAQRTEDVEGVLQRIRQSLAEPVELAGDVKVYASASVGYCFYPGDGEKAEDLLRNADTAMYRAKEQGKSQASRFELPMNESIQRRVALERDLRHAIANAELEMYYQPQLELSSSTLCGFEALIRWSVNGQFIPTIEFIRVAEETGLIKELDYYVIETVMRQVATWLQAGYDPGEVAINVSALSMQDPAIVEFVTGALARHAIPEGRIKLEVTEGLLMKNVDVALKIMQDLKTAGIRWSIDDFGTGYSALSYLRRYPFSQLKIDKSFIDDVHLNVENASMTRATISMAHSLGISVVAEGVETVEQLSFLLQAGCEQIQGYYYSPPLPVSSCAQLLAHDGSLQLPKVVLNRNPRTLLVLDTDLRVHSYLFRDLSEQGYHILNVDSTEAALNVLAINEVGVIMVDPSQRSSADADLLSRLKRLHPNVVRVAMSSYIDVETVLQAINEGAVFRYLTKPWQPEQLKHQLRDAFRQFDLQLQTG
ncbi:putative signaling protein [Andreprevotia sp. IGB-42]|uniref:EAL domain-containing protein n=1 Tax=Andreprevotia sp. IGB-42 TaxID=2497473 RepID=UPI00135732E0|nr:EAL domain-containing protein [Andreprevotia sp. IGB-42]KAF0812871.1 putative signaling protein [Andreprevotia sp. IGB-42]